MYINSNMSFTETWISNINWFCQYSDPWNTRDFASGAHYIFRHGSLWHGPLSAFIRQDLTAEGPSQSHSANPAANVINARTGNCDYSVRQRRVNSPGGLVHLLPFQVCQSCKLHRLIFSGEAFGYAFSNEINGMHIERRLRQVRRRSEGNSHRAIYPEEWCPIKTTAM